MRHRLPDHRTPHRGVQAQEASLLLLHQALSSTPSNTHPAAASPAATATLALHPLLLQVAYGARPAVKALAAQALAACAAALHSLEASRHVPPAQQPPTPSATDGAPHLHAAAADLALLRQACHVIQHQQACRPGAAQWWWEAGGNGEAGARWVDGLRRIWGDAQGAARRAAQAARAASSAVRLGLPGGGGGGGDADPHAQLLSPAPLQVLAALLASRGTAAAAAGAARALLALVPAAGVGLMPSVLFSLRLAAAGEAGPGGREQGGAAGVGGGDAGACGAVLGVLASLLAAPTAAPLAARALQPMQAAGAPVALRCLALRAAVQAWLSTGKPGALCDAAVAQACCSRPNGSSALQR